MTAPIVSSVGRYAVGGDLVMAGANTTGSNAWPLARRVIYVPLYTPEDMTIERFWWVNGGAASGNVDVGIYSSTNDLPVTKLSSSGSTAVSGVNALMSVAASGAPYALAAGNYFLAAMADGTGVWMFRTAQTGFTDYHKQLGMCMETVGAGSTLPATATPVTIGTNNYLPTFGFSTVTVL